MRWPRDWRRLLLAGAGVLAIAGLALGLGLRSSAARASEQRVRKTRLTFRVKATGQLASAASLTISPPLVPYMWDYTVTQLAPEGKSVAVGQPLVSFDAKKLAERAQLKSAELAEAEKELEKVKLEEQERLDGLLLQQADQAMKEAKAARKLEVPPDLLARLELEKNRLDYDLAREESRLIAAQIEVQKINLEAQVQAARNKVERTRRELATTQDSIRRLNVQAPRAGFLVYVPGWNGKKVAQGDNVWFGQNILEIADLTKMRVDAVIPEPDAAVVRAAQSVEIRLAANPDRLFHGRIQSLGRIFRTKSYDKPSMVFDAVVAIDKPDPEIMRPGMAADIVVLATSSEPVPVVPEEAVHFTTQGPRVTVRRDGEGAREVPVKLGRRSPPMVEVLAGLAEGDEVIVPTSTRPAGAAEASL